MSFGTTSVIVHGNTANGTMAKLLDKCVRFEQRNPFAERCDKIRVEIVNGSGFRLTQYYDA